MATTLLVVILAAAILLFVTRWLPIAVTSLSIPPALYFSGILGAEQAFSGFSNAATITIGALFIVSAGLVRTGTLDVLTNMLRRGARGSPTRVLLILAVVVPFISAFMNNIPVVAMLIPVMLVLARELKVSPSKFMIPLSYFAILGGTCTLIGTGTNVVVHDLYRTWQSGQGLEPKGFGMFDFTIVGTIILTAGVIYLFTIGRRLLPDRTSLTAMMAQGRTAQFVTEILVQDDSRLQGMLVEEVFPAAGKVRLLELIRNEFVMMGSAMKEAKLESGDALIISGASKEITEFLRTSKAALAPVLEDAALVPMRSVELVLAEAVVLPDGPFVGRRVQDLHLNRNHGVSVLAIQRGGRHHRKDIKNLRLQGGDVLLLQSSTQGFQSLRESEGVLLAEGLEGLIRHRERAPVAICILLGIVLLAAFTPLPIMVLSVAGAALMLIAGCLRADEAFGALDASVLLLLAGTIPLGVALESTGLASEIVAQLMRAIGDGSPWIVLSVLYLMTSVITEFLSNKATAVLLTPIALQLATSMGVSPVPFLMAICFAASASFATPIGYPANLLVFGPGGYRFTDFVRVGVPLNLLTWILASILLPIFFPF